CAGVPARIFAATISCPSCTPKAATDDIKNLSGIHAGLPEGHDDQDFLARHGLFPPPMSPRSNEVCPGLGGAFGRFSTCKL
ncbi:MAG: hypothetical protein ACREYE_20425, partial [Gammaproteobacteria bacterium]